MPPHRPPLPLVSREEMGRLRVRSNENDKLAESWSRESVVLVTMNWRPAYEFNNRRQASVTLEVMRRDGSRGGGRPGGLLSIPEHRYLMYVVPDGREPYIFHNSDDNTYYEMPKAGLAANLRAIFGELSRRYSKVCVCSLQLRNVLNGLDTLGFRLPKGTAMVDLVKVVEFQSEPDSIQEMLREGRGPELVERQTRYGAWAGAGHLTGEASATRILLKVGPRAHEYREDLRRMERESRAVERLREPLGAREATRIRREQPRVRA